MSLKPGGTLADPQQIVADLRRELEEARAERDNAQRKLNERTTERDEALARETAMAEVLQVINSSPGDLVPVFDAMLERATRLCEASFGTLSKIDGDQFCGMAWHNAPAAFVETMRQSRTIVPGNAHYRLLRS